MREIVLLRRNLAGAGGAERVFKKYVAAFSGECEVVAVGGDELRGAGWWKALRYASKADKVLSAHPNAWSLSLERGPKAMVYRAGDGVHRRFLELEGRGFSLNPTHAVMPHLEARSVKSARIIIANSHMVEADLRRFYPEAAEKIRVVYNGFDPRRFGVADRSKAELRRELGLPETGALFLFVGSGWRRKGVKQAERIAALAKAQLVVVGKGDAGSLERETIYRGVVENVADYYRACDGFVLPTSYDPFANVTLEALACGLPVVTTKNNGASEIIRAGETGYIIDSPDSDHAQAAAWLASKIGADPAAIAPTVAEFTLAREIAEIKKIFAEIEANPPKA